MNLGNGDRVGCGGDLVGFGGDRVLNDELNSVQQVTEHERVQRRRTLCRDMGPHCNDTRPKIPYSLRNTVPAGLVGVESDRCVRRHRGSRSEDVGLV